MTAMHALAIFAIPNLENALPSQKLAKHPILAALLLAIKSKDV